MERHIDQARLGEHLDQELVFKFFAAFSRFEYALKNGGFVQRGRSGNAEPAWRRFEDAIDDALAQHVAECAPAREAIAALAAAPPKQQLPSLGWGEIDLSNVRNQAHKALLCVRTIRNNLFHGGKANRQRQDAERDNALMRNALVVLNAALACHDEVRARFVEV